MVTYKERLRKNSQPYVSFLDINKQLTMPFRNQLNKSVGYYTKDELEPIKSPPEVPRKTKASELLPNLMNCKPGKEHWKKYQDICKEILSYCLVPHLTEPLEQSETRDGMHIRDIIFHIPHELKILDIYYSKFQNSFSCRMQKL